MNPKTLTIKWRNCRWTHFIRLTLRPVKYRRNGTSRSKFAKRLECAQLAAAVGCCGAVECLGATGQLRRVRQRQQVARTPDASRDFGVALRCGEDCSDPVRPCRAFTMIELLCVIAIMGILAALLLPALG